MPATPTKSSLDYQEHSFSIVKHSEEDQQSIPEELPTQDLQTLTSPVPPGRTVEQTVYEACDGNLIRDVIYTGVNLKSETASYTVIRLVNPSQNLYEAIIEDPNIPRELRKVLLRVYDADDAAKFANEVEKLNLLNQIMEELGEQSFLVQMIESFQSEVGSSRMSVYCIVMEHLELSLADYLANLSAESNQTNCNAVTLEYSLSDESIQDFSPADQKSACN